MAVLHDEKVKYVMPAEMYDAIEFAAEVHGGVGGGMMYADPERTIPLCAHGLLEFARGRSDWQTQGDLEALGITPDVNDRAVWDVISKDTMGRVSFASWCRRLKVVRGV